jgi:hypothetical protein
MSRRLEVAYTAPVVGGFAVILTVPAGMKYEVIDCCVAGDFANPWAYELGAVTVASGLVFYDTITVPANVNYVHHQYGGLVLHAGDILFWQTLSTGTAPSSLASVHYVEVNPGS